MAEPTPSQDSGRSDPPDVGLDVFSGVPATTEASLPQRTEPHTPVTSASQAPPSGPLASIAGFGVTLATMAKRPVTQQYPEHKRPTAPRFHGRHQLNRHPDGLEKCVGCELCAWACPADAIFVEGADNTDQQRFSPGERYGRVYQINYLRCIFCGLCIEACPTRALTMTNEYELADDDRVKLIYEKQDLLAPLTEGMVEVPHPMVTGTTEADYYSGGVVAATVEQQQWVRQRGSSGGESGGEAAGGGND